MQLLVPAIFVAYFWRHDDRHAAMVALWWVAQNLWNVSVYVQDARVWSCLRGWTYAGERAEPT